MWLPVGETIKATSFLCLDSSHLLMKWEYIFGTFFGAFYATLLAAPAKSSLTARSWCSSHSDRGLLVWTGKKKLDTQCKKPLLLGPLSLRFSSAALCPFACPEQSAAWRARRLPAPAGCRDVLNCHALLPIHTVTSNYVHSCRCSAPYRLSNPGMLPPKVGVKRHWPHALPPNQR